MSLTARERQMLERAESRGVTINWAALDRRFNLTCSPIVTHGVSIDVLVELAELTTKLIEKSGKPLTLSGVVLFPTICDPAIFARADRITHKRQDNAYFVVRGIDFEVWKRARHLKRLALAVESYESSLAWIPERHLPAGDRLVLVGTLRKAAAQIKSRYVAAARRRVAARAA
jgi:hypothetical protein